MSIAYRMGTSIEIFQSVHTYSIPSTSDRTSRFHKGSNKRACCCFGSLSPGLLRRRRKLLETLGAIYTKPLVGRVWKVLEMPRDVHTSLHYGGRHERSPRLSRRF
ncbi:hypothetical protein AAG906_016710 [Vitis piasezkii]